MSPQQDRLALAEGIARLLLAVVAFALLIWLVVADPVLSSNAQVGVKALMAFSFAALMSSMAGLIEVKGRPLGLVIRAMGGFAIFVIVWFTLPRIIGNLETRAVSRLNFGPLQAFDIRSMDPPTTESGRTGKSGVALTVPVDLTAVSKFSAAHPAVLQAASARIVLGDKSHAMPWYYFVRHVPGAKNGTWLSADPKVEVARALEVSVGSSQRREVMFASSPGALEWGDFIRHLDGGGKVQLTVEWKTLQEGGALPIAQECAVSGTAERPTIRQMLSESRYPSQIVFNCGT